MNTQRHPVPLYYQLKTLLCQMIDNDELKPGECIPSERELSEKYEISRMTVRQAITEMVQEGRLIRRQGKGTFVAEPKIEQGLIALSSFTEDMVQRGLRPSTRLIEVRVEEASRRLAKLLNLGVDGRIMVVERLRLADGAPMALEFSHLPYSRCGELKEEDWGRSSLYQLLEERLGIQLGRARQTLEPVLADAHEAELLEVEKGSPLLLLERTTLDTLGVPVEFVRSFYRGDRYKFYVELNRQQRRSAAEEPK